METNMPKTKTKTKDTATKSRKTAKVSIIVNRADKRRAVKPEDVIAAADELVELLREDPDSLSAVTDRITSEASTLLAEARGKLTTRDMALDAERAKRKQLEAKLAEKDAEIAALNAAKPEPVIDEGEVILNAKAAGAEIKPQGSAPPQMLSQEEYVEKNRAAEAKKHGGGADVDGILKSRHQDRCKAAHARGKTVCPTNCERYSIGVKRKARRKPA